MASPQESWVSDKKRGYATALECRRMAAVGETECPISPGNPPGSPGRHYRYPSWRSGPWKAAMKSTPFNQTRLWSRSHDTHPVLLMFEILWPSLSAHQLTLFLISYSILRGKPLEGFPRLFVLSKLGREENFSAAADNADNADNAGPDIPAPIGEQPTKYLSQHRWQSDWERSHLGIYPPAFAQRWFTRGPAKFCRFESRLIFAVLVFFLQKSTHTVSEFYRQCPGLGPVSTDWH